MLGVLWQLSEHGAFITGPWSGQGNCRAMAPLRRHLGACGPRTRCRFSEGNCEAREFKLASLGRSLDELAFDEHIIKGRPFGVGFECWLIPYKKGTPFYD